MAGDLVAQWWAEGLNDSLDDGAAVPAWVDTVGGISAGAVGDPVLKKQALSGRSVVQFDAGDGHDGFRVATSDSPMSGAEDYSLVVVFRTDSSDLQGGTGPWYENTGLLDANRIGFGKDWGLSINAAGQVATGVGEGSFVEPAKSVYSNETGLNDGQVHVATVTRSGSDLSIYVDDHEPASIDNVNPDPRDMIDLTIGMLQQGDARGFTGDIAEVRIYDGMLTGAEVRSMFADLNRFYNNAAPSAEPDSYTFAEDPPFFHSVDAANGVLANDTDAEGDQLTAKMVEGPTNGSIALSADGSFTYAPHNDFFGNDSFTYTANDAQPSDVTTVSLTVTNVYDPPVPADDEYKIQPTETLAIPGLVGVLGNDANPDRNSLVAVEAEPVSFGTATLSGDGGLQFDPQGQPGIATLTYRLDDQTGNGLSEAATVTIVVNTPPVANDDTLAVTEDTPLVLSAEDGVGANDTDADGDSLTYSLVDPTEHGTVTLGSEGQLEYVPNENYFGSDRFTYRLSDGEDTSELATVTLNVEAVNDAPVGGEDAYFIAVDTTLAINGDGGVLQNDHDVEGDPMTVTVADAPSSGNVTLQPDGALEYVPNAGFQGNDTFTYTINDGKASSSPVSVTLLVGNPPVQISEVMAANASLETSLRADPSDRFPREKDTPDWIELRNLTSAELNIGGYHLTDDPDNLTRWQFPAGTTIPADGQILVFASRQPTTDPELDELGALHTNFKIGVEGEYLAVSSPLGQVIHELEEMGQQRANISYGVMPDGTMGLMRTATPGEANVAGMYSGILDPPAISQPRGFYDATFEVTLSAENDLATIRYTIDGSEPTADNGRDYDGPISISTTTVVKAKSLADGYVPSLVNAQTYVFAEHVFQQDNSGPEGAIHWGHAGPDYEMDPEIINHEDPEIRPELEDLKRIPTVSVAIDTDLFLGERDGDPGIYIRGENEERPITFEYFDPNTEHSGVVTNSTIQVVGGSSPNRWKSDNLSLRVRFTEDAGESELEYPLFGPQAATAFDTMVLDARLNNVWHYGGGSSPSAQRGRAQYMRDEFAADLQNALGGYAPHGQHVHVYINGIYWGMRTMHERPDDNFAASYLGGVSEEWNVIKHTAGEVINGSNDSFLELNSILGRSGDLSDEAYEQAQQLLDIDNFINYMQANFYGGNADWDHHNWYASQSPLDGKWRFHSWDAEKFLESLNDDSTRNNNRNAPSGMHRRLMTHPEYALRFADLVQENFYHDGAMTPDATAALYRWRSDQIDLVTRVESARWGDNQRSEPFNRLDWLRVRNDLFEDYFPERTDRVIGQFERNGWFSAGQAPEFQVDGSDQHGGQITPGSMLSMSGPDGTIYYTSDGSDPRLAGGDLADQATEYSGPIALDTTREIHARVQFADGSWGPLSAATFRTSVSATRDNLRISELMYHPSDVTQAEEQAGITDADEFEFIELVNVSHLPVDLSEVYFQQSVLGDELEGIQFAFADSEVTELAAGERVVVVENLEAFALRYGDQVPVAGVWSGGLNNSDERVVLMAGDSVLADFRYSDDWYPDTDGDGHSLQVVDELGGDPDLLGTAEAWRASVSVGGSPGVEDGTIGDVPGDSNRDGVFDSSDLVVVFQAGKYETDQPASFEEGDWNSDGLFTTSDLVFAFKNGSYQPAPAAVAIRQDAAPGLLLAHPWPADDAERDRSVISVLETLRADD